MSRHTTRGVGVTDAMSRNAGAASEIQGQNIKDPVGKNLKNAIRVRRFEKKVFRKMI